MTNGLRESIYKKRQHHRHHARNQLHDTLIQPSGNRVDLVGKAAHHIPAGMGVVIAERQPTELAEQVSAQRLHRAVGRPIGTQGGKPVEQQSEQVHHADHRKHAQQRRKKDSFAGRIRSMPRR